MRLPGLVMLRVQHFFEARQDIAERVYDQGPGLMNYFEQVVVGHGTDDDRQLVAVVPALIDFIPDRMHLFQRIDEGYRTGLKLVVRELRQQAQSQRFSGNRGTV